MTKAELADAIRARLPDLSVKEASALVTDLLDIMKEALAAGDNVKVTGFGVFEVKSKAARMGRNPQTGAPILIAARRVITFTPSEKHRELMNDVGQQVRG